MPFHKKIQDLSEMRDASEYSESLETLFLAYVRTEEYVSLSKEQRNKIVDIVLELRQLTHCLKEIAASKVVATITLLGTLLL